MPRDAVVGAVVLAFAGLYWLAAGTIRHSSLDDSIGAAGLPNTLAVLLAGLAVLLIARSLLLKPRPVTQLSSGVPSETPRAHLRALGMLALGVAYLLVVPVLGYTVSVALLVGAVAVYNHQQLSTRLVLVAVLVAAGFYLLFVQLLGIPLPHGRWLDLISS